MKTDRISGDDVTYDDMDGVYIMADADKRALHEYNERVEMYRENANDKCVQLFMHKHTSGKYDLDILRCEYFEHLKEVDHDFPFDRNVNLYKRRMFTRSGEP
ncbi:hypothetical protein DPMN_145024 [Dreissena polymorpha]|uniref:Uncharacterized protein n=1 Tax=Dreissena polymorpha TaxID=45954 RepID=A0A9D4F558_DREPO|nr:hypothetical protein DPMN_145024 [Dreissena polymorpha]